MTTPEEHETPAVRAGRATWHTVTVDASADYATGVIGVGAVLQATHHRKRRGPVQATFSEAYLGVPAHLAEEFAVLRALEIAMAHDARLVKVRSDYNHMRKRLKRDHAAGLSVVGDGLHSVILRLAQRFDEVKFGYVPRRKNHIAHRLAREARQRSPRWRHDVDWGQP